MTCGCSARKLLATCMMDAGESVQYVFMMVRDRFKIPPSLIIYDNACHLAIYCLSKELYYFWSVKFLVDRFHSSNHTTCSRVYHFRAYDGGGIFAVNSEACEQINRIFQRVEKSIMQMTLPHAMIFQMCFVSLINNKHKYLR